MSVLESRLIKSITYSIQGVPGTWCQVLMTNKPIASGNTGLDFLVPRLERSQWEFYRIFRKFYHSFTSHVQLFFSNQEYSGEAEGFVPLVCACAVVLTWLFWAGLDVAVLPGNGSPSHCVTPRQLILIRVPAIVTWKISDSTTSMLSAKSNKIISIINT